MEYEIIMNKLAQIGLIATSGFVYLVNQIDGSIISKAFDQLFSIGLLLIACYLLYREWKSSQEYNEKRDERLETIVENNTQALVEFKREITNIHDRIDENSRRIDDI